MAMKDEVGEEGGNTRKASSWRLECDAESEKEEKEVGNKSQESGRVESQERKGRRESEWDTQTLNFQRRGWRNKENDRKIRGSMRERK